LAKVEALAEADEGSSLESDSSVIKSSYLKLSPIGGTVH
jgi:hypothetical protein